MNAEFRLPDLGEGLTEAEVVQWLVAPGDTVTLNQTLAEVETAKAIVELPSGLRYEIITQGSGPTPKTTETVKVHYTGTLIDGSVFDSSVQRGEPVLGELRSDAAPLHACSGPHAPGPGVDGGLLELADVDEECVLERAVRVGVVAGGLRRNAQPVVAGVFHGRDDVADVLGERDCGGPQVRCQVEHLPRRVPVGVRRGHDASAHLRGQGLELTGSEHLDHPFIEQSVYRSAMLT